MFVLFRNFDALRVSPHEGLNCNLNDDVSAESQTPSSSRFFLQTFAIAKVIRVVPWVWPQAESLAQKLEVRTNEGPEESKRDFNLTSSIRR